VIVLGRATGTNRGVCVEVGTHVLDLELQLLLSPSRGPLYHVSIHDVDVSAAQRPTLKARCSRKCAVPFVSSVSARDPASIHMPTVEV